MSRCTPGNVPGNANIRLSIHAPKRENTSYDINDENITWACEHDQGRYNRLLDAGSGSTQVTLFRPDGEGSEAAAAFTSATSVHTTKTHAQEYKLARDTHFVGDP